MGHVTLGKGGLTLGVAHLGRNSLYEKCNIEEGIVYMGHVTLRKGRFTWDMSH